MFYYKKLKMRSGIIINFLVFSCVYRLCQVRYYYYFNFFNSIYAVLRFIMRFIKVLCEKKNKCDLIILFLDCGKANKCRCYY